MNMLLRKVEVFVQRTMGGEVWIPVDAKIIGHIRDRGHECIVWTLETDERWACIEEEDIASE